MSNMKGEKVILRALEPADLEFLYLLENDDTHWEVSNTLVPYSKYILKQYIAESHRDIFDVKQLRLVICDIDKNQVKGYIDLYDFDPKNKRVGLGIIILSKADRRKGYATESVELICNYAFGKLDVHQIYALISEDNMESIALFEKVGFERTGVKKDWLFSQRSFKNVLFYQLIKDVH